LGKKRIKKNHINTISLVFSVIYLSLLYTIVSLISLPQKEKEINIEILPPESLSATSLEKKELSILPTGIEDIEKQFSLFLTYEDKVMLLNNGFVFLPINDKEIDMSETYKKMIESRDDIYVSSEIVKHYFQFERDKIKNKIVQDTITKELNDLVLKVERKISIVKLNPNIDSNHANSLNRKLKLIRSALLKTKFEKAEGIFSTFSVEEKEIFLRICKKVNKNSDLENIDNILIILNIPTIFSSTEEASSKQEINSFTYTKTELGEISLDKKNIYIQKNPEFYNQLLLQLEYLEQNFLKVRIKNSEIESLKSDIKKILDYSEGNITEENQMEKILVDIFSINIMGEGESKVGLLILSKDEKAILSLHTTNENINYLVDNSNFSKEYAYTPIPQIAGSVRIPALMYHQIGTAPEGSSEFKKGLYLSEDMFEQQIAYLTKMNYKSVNSEEFYELLQNGKNPEQKTVLLTFDDATVGHYYSAYPVLKKYGHIGVFFVPSARSSVPYPQLREMSDNGMDIQSHTSTHPDLTRISDSSILQREIGGSKLTLESVTEKEVISIAYPGCVGNPLAFNITANSGYKLGFSCGRSIDHLYIKRLALNRVHAPHSMDTFKKALSGLY
jgi:peptidoglycan/xylan/chitin deacetylase (PgdA/CDA1 family)